MALVLTYKGWYAIKQRNHIALFCFDIMGSYNSFFFAAVYRDSVSLFRFPLSSRIQFISWAIYWVCCFCVSFSRYSFHHHHHHIALVARISLTLSRHSSLSFIALGRSSGQHPVSSHSCWMYVRAGRPAFARPCVGIHKSTSLMSSSLLKVKMKR